MLSSLLASSLALSAPAAAAPQAQLTALAGGRLAPESTVLLPSGWESEFEPGALAALDAELRLGGAGGAWCSFGGDAWGYAPEGEATSLGGRAALGWSGGGDAARVDVAGRYDLEWYPSWAAGLDGRGELMARAALGEGLVFRPRVSVVDRRYLDVPSASFSYAVAIAELGLPLNGPVAVDLGAGGQVNQDQGFGSEGLVGAQLRGLARLTASGGPWHGSLEYWLTGALQGEAEHDVRPLFTPWSDYSEDADALSGGGFVQHRLSLTGAVVSGKWTVSVGALGRLRTAGEDELAAAYAQTGQVRVEVDRALGGGVVLFGSVGAASATSPAGLGYGDAWGWAGLRWRPGSGG